MLDPRLNKWGPRNLKPLSLVKPYRIDLSVQKHLWQLRRSSDGKQPRE